jgi:hypothetical protein
MACEVAVERALGEAYVEEKRRADSEEFWEAVIREADAGLRDKMHAHKEDSEPQA